MIIIYIYIYIYIYREREFFIIIKNQMGDPVIHAILSKCFAIVRNFNYGGISAKYYLDINKP